MNKSTEKYHKRIPSDRQAIQQRITFKGRGVLFAASHDQIADQYYKFEDRFPDVSKTRCHHEEGLSTQQTFMKQVAGLSKTISDLGNPFVNDYPELLGLDTSDVMNESVANTVRTVELLGRNQYEEYRQSVLVDCTRSIHDPIKKNSLPTFKCPTRKDKTKQSHQIENLKCDVRLFSELYIVAQDSDTNMHTFFQDANHPYSPSL